MHLVTGIHPVPVRAQMLLEIGLIIWYLQETFDREMLCDSAPKAADNENEASLGMCK